MLKSKESDNMNDVEFTIIVFAILIAVYVFIRNVFNKTHQETLFTIIISMLGAFVGLSFDPHKERGEK